jgi:DnaJ-class molecular chaperone
MAHLCANCNGRRYVWVRWMDIRKCPACEGTGIIHDPKEATERKSSPAPPPRK